MSSNNSTIVVGELLNNSINNTDRRTSAKIYNFKWNPLRFRDTSTFFFNLHQGVLKNYCRRISETYFFTVCSELRNVIDFKLFKHFG